MQTYRIGVDEIPNVGGIAFFENVQGGSHPVAAYEALTYRAGDFFIDHEETRQGQFGEYPVYEVLTPAQFAEKYPTDVPDPLPGVKVVEHAQLDQEAKKYRDTVFVSRDTVQGQMLQRMLDVDARHRLTAEQSLVESVS